jgi:hypothetical protein
MESWGVIARESGRLGKLSAADYWIPRLQVACAGNGSTKVSNCNWPRGGAPGPVAISTREGIGDSGKRVLISHTIESGQRTVGPNPDSCPTNCKDNWQDRSNDNWQFQWSGWSEQPPSGAGNSPLTVALGMCAGSPAATISKRPDHWRRDKWHTTELRR